MPKFRVTVMRNKFSSQVLGTCDEPKVEMIQYAGCHLNWHCSRALYICASSAMQMVCSHNPVAILRQRIHMTLVHTYVRTSLSDLKHVTARCS
jgi:hypothetical protein